VAERVKDAPDGPRRLDGLDLARGVAVLSVLVAHLSPLSALADVGAYLTAPLFAVVIGASLGLRVSRQPPEPAAGVVIDNLVRGALLVALGLALQPLYDQVVVILPYLGLLVVVLAPLALLLRSTPVLTVGLAAAGAVLSPVVMARARNLAADGGDTLGTASRTLLEWTATGYPYRLSALLPMALGGLALAAVLPRAGRGVRGVAVAAVLFTTSVAVSLVGAASADGASAYSGTTAEIVGATFLASGAVVLAFLVVDVGRRHRLGAAVEPLLATGRLALTAYTLQVLLLAGVGAVRGGAPDDGWALLVGTAVVVVAACWVLDRRWGTGPLEWLVRRLRVPASRRSLSARSDGSP
jgi:uncharacterized membrane protein YeiB